MYACYKQGEDWEIVDYVYFQQREVAQLWINRERMNNPQMRVGGFVLNSPISVSPDQNPFEWLRRGYDTCVAVMWPEQELGRMPGTGLGILRSRSYASWYDGYHHED